MMGDELRDPARLDPAAIERIVGGALRPPGRIYWVAIALLAGGVAIGAAAFARQMVAGLGVAGINHPVGWGVYIATFVFWIGIAHSGTLLSAILYFTRARFRLPLARAAEGMTVIALLVAGLFPLIHLGQPGSFTAVLPLPNRRDLWPNFNSPLTWDVLAITTYLFVSGVFFLLGLIPDLAAMRDGSVGLRRRLYAFGAGGFRGATAEYASLRRAHRLLAAIAAALVIVVSSVVSFDFSMSLEPGWHSTLFAPYFVAGAIHSGLAMVFVLLVPLRRALGLAPLITLDHLEDVARLLLVTTTLVGLFYVSELFTAWLSGDVFERAIMSFRAFGPYAPAFWFMVAANVIAPASLAWKRARRSPRWLFALGLLVLAGMWIERFVIVVTTTAHDFLPGNWGSYVPSPTELGVLVGACSLFALLYLLFVRHVPPVAMAELKAALPGSESVPIDMSRAPAAAATMPPRGALPRGSGVLGVFASARAAWSAARALAAAGITDVEVMAPFSLPAFRREDSARAERTLRAAALAGGVAGAGVGIAFPAWSASVYGRWVGAKPELPWPSYLVISCEAALLFASGACLIVLAVELARHGRRLRRVPRHPRLTRDRCGVFAAGGVDAAAGNRALMAAAGAEEVCG